MIQPSTLKLSEILQPLPVAMWRDNYTLKTTSYLKTFWCYHWLASIYIFILAFNLARAHHKAPFILKSKHVAFNQACKLKDSCRAPLRTVRKFWLLGYFFVI